MSNVEEFPLSIHRRPTEFEALVAAGSAALDAIPGAVYLCDAEGLLVAYNSEALELWGRTPSAAKTERFCGSHQLYLLDGTPLAHCDCPMATAVRLGTPTRNAEVIMARPDGSRFTALVNIRALRDHSGRIQGAINCFQDITGRKQVEEEVRRKTQDVEDFFENGAVGLHIVSGEGIILRANKAELDMLGYRPEEYIGRHIAEFHADAPVIGDILQRLSCGQALEAYPARLRARDGSVRHVLITSNSRFVDGKFTNTRCFTVDVTQLRAAEEQRRASEARLAATYEAANVGISETDENGRFLRVNDALCRITGRSHNELLGMTFSDYTDLDDRLQDGELYAQQVRGDIANYAIRKRVLRPDGSVRHLDIFSSSVRNSKGRFLYGVRVAQDVTATQQLEDRLREGEQRMRDLLEALPAAIYTTDAEGRINFFNRAAVEMAGRTPQPGDEWCVTWKLYWPDGSPLPHNECPMAVALRENRPVRGAEAIAERPDGRRVPFIPYPTPLRDAAGKLVGAINMLVDISERKRAENAQKVLIDELNHRVKNTLATVQSLASQTARHAADLDEFVSTFTGRLLALARAHDLLTMRNWQDAPFEKLIHDIVGPVSGGRVATSGPDVNLDARAALSVTMVFNELLTNATKYGALSKPHGSVSLTWRIAEGERSQRRLACEWLERGGPPVTPPKRRGFGTRLMERCVENDLAGEFDLIFDPQGARCTVAFPVMLSASNG
ncbi:PAS domain S-box protein [Bradyrhizobium sp. 182]|uniref:PAS domain-containing sensor histidine kinase n=1 Tax=unclassified Bradyrhizobium TaxID=2631580 RepID=UPI001FF73523|nr:MULTISPECIES: PAS domain S-box protein [unclassified Bradyrhizobium]MCK1423566.1 PAS domain S-box protein [Bradyrhizobium sp. CW12]MCK1526239.1 PAS domain S-box protein [Bradyrhizobium sp. 182]MCK1647365.1 PAS domain S-box protein [Bradyrhizobium sp. 154]MCK1663919.1 PAS domain S-box protein [Bradyrhizobium sp. 153]